MCVRCGLFIFDLFRNQWDDMDRVFFAEDALARHPLTLLLSIEMRMKGASSLLSRDGS